MIAWYWLIVAFGLGLIGSWVLIGLQAFGLIDHSADSDNVTSSDSTED